MKTPFELGLELINDHLHLDLSETLGGVEYKGWVPDPDGQGRTKTYLNREECEALGRAFLEIAGNLTGRVQSQG